MGDAIHNTLNCQQFSGGAIAYKLIFIIYICGALFSLDYSRNERKKSPLPMWERVGVRGIIQRFPLPSIPSRQGRGRFIVSFCE